MEIKHNNIIYVSDISIIGGVETYVYEMVKKYHNLDIAVVYKSIHPTQLQRIRKYCPAYKFEGQDIICKVAVINYDTTIIPYIKEGKIYQGIHADYENEAYQKRNIKVPQDKRVFEYIAVTQHVADSFKKMTGNENVRVGYNPLTIDDEEPLVLVSATRLSSIKGKDRMIKLAEALDNAEINYIWYVFTNDIDNVHLPNFIYMKPRLDVGKWISKADYLVQLSDTEACSYAINEALYRNVPVIVTPLPYLSEIGVEDGKNAYIMEFDCSNIDHIVNNIENVPKFQFKKLPDSYNKILAKGKSKYEEKKKTIVKFQCTRPYRDLELQVKKKAGDEYEITQERAEYLQDELKVGKII